MGDFYVRRGDYLVRSGHCPDGMEDLQAGEGEIAHVGSPEGIAGQSPPFPGARWHISRQCWVDLRTEAEKTLAAQQAVIAGRVANYPPLAELADALYWQSAGDPTKYQAYMEKVASVKEQFPKI